MLLLLRSMLFSIGMIISTLLWGTLVLLSFPLPALQRYRIARQWGFFNIWWLKITCNIDHKLLGVENLPPGPAVVLVKHQSTWETLFLQKLFFPQSWVLKRELLRIPFFGWALALLEPIAIDRTAGRTAVKQVLRQGTERLKAGYWVIVFPEGTRVTAGVRGRYGIGGPLLAAHSGYPIVPIAHNAGLYWARGAFIKKPGTISVVIGPPIDSRGRTAQELKEITENWIETKVQELAPTHQKLAAKSSPADMDSR